MPIQDLCTRKLISIEKGSTLRQAAQLMKKHHIGDVVIVESNGVNKPIGILTDRDIVLGVVAENLPFSTSVDEIMSKNIVQVKRTEGIATVVKKMEREGVNRMIIVDDFGSVCGIVTSDDILRLVAKELTGLGKIVERQVENEKKHGEPQIQIPYKSSIYQE